MQLRFLEYFVALAQEKHFARAAEACHITQPTLSSGISALETELGSRLIVRNRRFIALTPEGEAILPWAQRILGDSEALRHAASAESNTLNGELTLGVIPAALPITGAFAAAIAAQHPGITLAIHSLPSRDIERGLVDHALDAGITYLNDEPLNEVRHVSLYTERYVLVTRGDEALGHLPSISWARAAASPLCLLHGGMQNRRILDRHLASLNLSVTPRIIADSYVTLLSIVQAGGVSSIIPHSYASMVPTDGPLRLIEFGDHAIGNEIGLVIIDREPVSALGKVALDAAQNVRLDDKTPGKFFNPAAI